MDRKVKSNSNQIQPLHVNLKRKPMQIRKAVGILLGLVYTDGYKYSHCRDHLHAVEVSQIFICCHIQKPLTQFILFCQDWNTFLLRFNELDFCVSENETIKHGLNESTTPESMVVTSGQARSSTQAPLLLEDSGPINISVPITLTLDPQRPFGGYSRNITHLYATVLGQQVGLSGRFSVSSLQGKRSSVCRACFISGLKTEVHMREGLFTLRFA